MHGHPKAFQAPGRTKCLPDMHLHLAQKQARPCGCSFVHSANWIQQGPPRPSTALSIYTCAGPVRCSVEQLLHGQNMYLLEAAAPDADPISAETVAWVLLLDLTLLLILLLPISKPRLLGLHVGWRTLGEVQWHSGGRMGRVVAGGRGPQQQQKEGPLEAVSKHVWSMPHASSGSLRVRPPGSADARSLFAGHRPSRPAMHHCCGRTAPPVTTVVVVASGLPC